VQSTAQPARGPLPTDRASLTLPAVHRRRNGGGDGGARPRIVETTGATVSFRPRNIFPHFCMLFLKLPLCRYVAYIQLKRHTQLVLQVEYYEKINKTYIPSENFENRVTIEHLCESHISKTCDYIGLLS